MALIDYKDYFDLPGYTKAIKDVEQANKEFGSTVESINKKVLSGYNGIRAELQQYADILRNFNINQKDAAQNILATGKAAEKLKEQLAAQKQIMDDLNKTQDLSTKSINELKKAAAAYKAEYEAGNKSAALGFRRVTEAIREQTKALTAVTAEQAKESVARQQNLTLLKNQAREEAAAKGSLDQRRAALIRLKLAYDALAPSEREGTYGKRLESVIKGVHDQVSRLEQTTGRFQRNVGNYASAFNGLGNSVQQILREAPSAAVSINTFFLAISNNLPIFLDEIQKIKAAQKEANEIARASSVIAKEQAIQQAITAGSTKEMAIQQGVLAEKQALANAQATKAPSLMSQLGKSIFSINTALTLIVLGLTLFGGKIVNFISGLFGANKALDTFKENWKNINEVTAEANKEVGKQIVTLKVLRTTAQDVTLSYKERKAAADELQKQFPQTYKDLSDEIILAGKDKRAYDELTKSLLENARARAAKGKIDQIESELLDIADSKRKVMNATENELNAIEKKGAADRERFIEEQEKAGKKGYGLRLKDKDNVIKTEQEKIIARRNAALSEQQDREKILKDQQQFLIKYVGGEKKIAKAIEDGRKPEKEKKGKKEKTADELLADRVKKDQEIAKSQLDVAIKDQELLLSKKLISEEEFQINKLELISAYTETATALENEKKKKADKKTLNELIEARKSAEIDFNNFLSKLQEENNKWAIENAVKAIENERDARIQYLENEKSMVLESKTFTDTEREALEIDYQNRIDKIVIESLQRRQKLATASEKEALQRQIDDLNNAIAKRNLAFDNKAEKDGEKERLDGYDRELKAAERLFDFLSRGRKQSLFEQLYMIDRIYDARIKAAKSIEEKEQLIADKKAARERAIVDAVLDGISKIQDRLKKASEERIGLLEQEKNVELERVGNNAAAREKIEKEFNKRINQEKARQARIDRDAALFEIAINTAIAVMTVTGQTGVGAAYLVPLIIASGAIQAAFVASQPLPKYKKGRQGGPAELAEVDEEGFEMIVDRHGKLKEIGTNKGPRKTWLDQGDKVLTHSQSVKELRSLGSLTQSLNDAKQREAVYTLARAMQISNIHDSDKIVQAIKERPHKYSTWDERGVRHHEESINARKTYLNNRGY